MSRIVLCLSLSLLVFIPTTAAQDKKEKSLSGSELIDSMVEKVWDDNDIKPARMSSDSEFLRRLSLDVTGTVPKLDRTLAFLKDRSRNKRADMVERLLNSSDYAKHWGRKWVDTMLGTYLFVEAGRGYMYMQRMEAAVQKRFAENQPYDEFVNELLTVTGQVTDGEEGGDPMVFWYMQYLRNRERSQALAGKTAKVFLGTQIQCAQCHDHPFDKWSQEDFNGMAAFWARTQIRRTQTNRAEEMKARKENKPRPRRLFRYSVADSKRGRFRLPDKPKVRIDPTYLETGEGVTSEIHWRESYAGIITSRNNKLFARAFVNRMWNSFFGRGIVDPFDDFTARNRPSIRGLLDALAQDFIDHKYDIHWLIKAIVNSDTYQRTSAVKKRDPSIEKFFPYARIRALSPSVLVETIYDATGLTDVEQRARMRERLLRTFRFAFQDDEGAEGGQFEGTIPQAMLLMNGQLADFAVGTQPGSFVRKLMDTYRSPEARVEGIFLAFLCRLPTREERSRFVQFVRKAKKDEAYGDVIWVIINSAEFLFNH